MSNSAAVVIQVLKDRGAKATSAALSGKSAGSGKGSNQNFIRRPTRGLQIKEDTFATIRLVALVDGTNRAIVDAGSRRTDKSGDPIEVNGKRATDIYSNFLLQAVSEERAEKSQVLETFGEPYIFLFGERPRMISFQGILVNSSDFNWESEWWYNYEEFLRGTRCVETDARVYIQYDTVLVGGYILAANASRNANEPYHVNFSFQLFVTSYTNFSSIGNPYAMPGEGVSPRYTSNNENNQLAATNNALVGQARPVLIPYVENLNGGLVGTGQLEMPSLFDSFSDTVSAVTEAWGKVSAVANTAASGILGQLDPAVIRVPYGFAGAMEFDEKASVNLSTTSIDNFVQSINYSVFSENEDEYVGSSDHYGTSEMQFDSFGWETPADKLTYGQEMYDTAATAWTEAGYPVELAQSGDLVRSMVGGQLGLIVSGIKATVIASTSGAGSAVPPVGSGIVASPYRE